MNKRGAEMAISTIIVIILALVVLVFLIYGFSVGWGNLFDKISNFGGGQSNVQTIVQSCNLACTTNSQYDWCSLQRDVTFSTEGKTDGKFTCAGLVNQGVGLEACAAVTCASA